MVPGARSPFSEDLSAESQSDINALENESPNVVCTIEYLVIAEVTRSSLDDTQRDYSILPHTYNLKKQQ